MPFRSEAQRKFLWAKHPGIARRWAHEYPGQKNLPEHVKEAYLEELEKISRVLYHGSPVKKRVLDEPEPGVGIYLATAPGLSAPFAIKRDDIGITGKMRIGARVWRLPPKEVQRPVPETVVTHTRESVPEREGVSTGYLYKIDTEKVRGGKFVPSKDEPREVIYRGPPIPVGEPKKIKIRWRTEYDPSLLKEQRKSTDKVKISEVVRGIPDRNKIQPIPMQDKPKPWRFVVQHHPAVRAGDHFDLRLNPPHSEEAHSWATKKELPKPGEGPIRVYQQPTHAAGYMDFRGPLGGTYGRTKKGKIVKPVLDEKVEVLESSNDQVRFNVYKGHTPQEFLMTRKRGEDGTKTWFLMNITQTKDKLKDLPFSKPSYKEIPVSEVDYENVEQAMTPKWSGSHSTFVLRKGRRPRIFSYREPKERTTGAIEHSHKVESLYNRRVQAPISDAMLRGELYARRHEGGPLPEEEVAGMLNANVWKSRRLQESKGQLRPALFDVIRYNGKRYDDLGYDEKIRVLKEIQTAMPEFEIPETALTAEEKRKLISDIKEKRHPATHEGVVLWHRTEGRAPIKAKFKSEHDVYIREVFQAIDKNGKPKAEAGGFKYSHTPDGPVVGNVGTGFSADLKKDMWANPKKYEGAVAKVNALAQFKSSALGKASFQGWHADKNDPTFWQANPVSR